MDRQSTLLVGILGLLIAVIVVLFLSLGKRNASGPHWFPLFLIYLASFTPIASTVLTPRISGGSGGYASFDVEAGPGVMIARVAAYAVLASVPAAIVIAAQRGRIRIPAVAGAFLAYAVVGLISASANRQPIDAALFYAAALIFSVMVTADWTITEALPIARRVLRVYVWGSLLLAMVAPGISFWSGQDREWLGIPQLAGVTTHPNGLGSIAGIAIFAELLRLPGLRNPSRWHLLAAIAVLLATQSRGAWFSVVLGALFYALGRARSRVLAVGVPLVLATILVFVALFQNTANPLDDIMQGRDLSTLNGRTTIWDQALSSFSHSPLLGFGPLAFDLRFRGSVLGLPSDPSHSNAHNQFVQALVERGLVGLFALIAFSALLIVAALHRPASQRGALLAISAVLVSRFAVETPLYILGASLNSCVLLLVVVLISSKEQHPPDGLTVGLSQAVARKSNLHP